MSDWHRKHYRYSWEKERDDPWNLKWEPNTNTVKDLHRKLNEKEIRKALGNMLINFMTPQEIVGVFTRMVNEYTACNKQVKISDINKARLLMMFPQLQGVFDFTEFDDNLKLALALRDFDRFIGDIDINTLTRKQVKLILEAKEAKPMKYLVDNMLPERMQEIFTLEMWKMLLKRYPHKAKIFDITQVRNQTELRRFIMERPSVMKYQTVERMKASVIPGPTWVRIVTQMTPSKRKYFPIGFKQWAERDIFTEMLKGRRFKPFSKNWGEGLRG